MTNLLFVYGTLLNTDNPIAVYLMRNCTFINKGKTKGVLYDIGEYPGLINCANNNNYVIGSIYRLEKPDFNLSIVDDYEGVGPNQTQPNLYTREIRFVETQNDVLEAWVYIYNLPVIGLTLITSGNYAEYIKQKKSPGL